VASAYSAENIAVAAPEAADSGRTLMSTMCSIGVATAAKVEDMAAATRRAEEGLRSCQIITLLTMLFFKITS
jgi:cytochrome c5